jgi:exosortase/archaeosortase family protein
MMAFKFPKKLNPYLGIIIFCITMLTANLIWKLTISGDELADSRVTFLSWDISVPFSYLAKYVAASSCKILQLLGRNCQLIDSNTIRYPGGTGTRIIWSCSGLKQMFIFFCILITSRGPWIKKLYFVPLAMILTHVINVLRITFITWFMEDHHEWFKLLHEHITKYAFYVVIFFIWVYWEERIVKNGKKNDTESTKSIEKQSN